MTEEVLFEVERKMAREDVAEYLRTVADNLDAGEDVALAAGGDSVTLSPPATPTFEVKAEREGEELSVEFELEWREGADGEAGDGDLEIR
ncbi:MAG: amphi-Trp domain-containing protein [Halobacteriales archaeon]